MDIGIYANPDYYFGYDRPRDARAIMADLTAATRRGRAHGTLMQAAQHGSRTTTSTLPLPAPALTVARAGVRGLWPNAPVAATDLAAISWSE
jgi:peptide/nickel transport system substrate-binding protein